MTLTLTARQIWASICGGIALLGFLAVYVFVTWPVANERFAPKSAVTEQAKTLADISGQLADLQVGQGAITGYLNGKLGTQLADLGVAVNKRPAVQVLPPTVTNRTVYASAPASAFRPVPVMYPPPEEVKCLVSRVYEDFPPEVAMVKGNRPAVWEQWGKKPAPPVQEVPVIGPAGLKAWAEKQQGR